MTYKTVTDSSYAHPEVLVDTEWLERHLQDEKIRVAQVDYDPSANYELGHIPGSVLIDWKKDINSPIQRNIMSRAEYESLAKDRL